MTAVKLLSRPFGVLISVALLCLFVIILWLPAGTVAYAVAVICLLLCFMSVVTLRNGANAVHLQNELAFLAKQIDEARDAIYTVDATGHITAWNHGAEKLYGYTRG